MERLYDTVWLCHEERVELVVFSRVLHRATNVMPIRPDASEECERDILTDREPTFRLSCFGVLAFKKGRAGHDAPAFRRKPSAPTWRGDVTDIRNTCIRLALGYELR